MRLFLTLISLSLFLSTEAQDSSPYWSLTGNSAANASSKLGTTNSIPLRLFTNNLERMRIDAATGKIAIGTTTVKGKLTLLNNGSTPAASWITTTNPLFTGFGETTGGNSDFFLAMASNTTTTRPNIIGRRARGTLASPLAVANNDYINSLQASGYDGAAFQNAANVDFFVDGTPSAGNVPMRISFTTGSNINNRSERLKIGSTGDIAFNNTQMFLQQSTGYLGLGKSPAYNLDVLGKGKFSDKVIVGVNANDINNAGVEILAKHTGEGAFYIKDNLNQAYLGGFSINGARNAVVANYDNTKDISFFAGNTYRMFVKANGNVGIGTPSPAALLHVNGNGLFTNGLQVKGLRLGLDVSANDTTNAADSTEVGIRTYGGGVGLMANGGQRGGIGILADGYAHGIYATGGHFNSENPQGGSAITGFSKGGYGVIGVSNSESRAGVYAENKRDMALVANGNFAGLIAIGSTYGVYTRGDMIGIEASGSYYAGMFNGDVIASGTYNTSDKNLKKNIENFDGAIALVRKLKPKAYEFRHEGDLAALNLPKGKHYGLIAQDVEAVVPNIVKATKHRIIPDEPMPFLEQMEGTKTLSAKGVQEWTSKMKARSLEIKAVNYTELIPVLVKAVQEQQDLIETQNKAIADLSGEVAELKALVNKVVNSGNSTTSLSNASLGTANPNPVKGSTIISYNIPQGSKTAHLLVTDMKGSIVKQILLNSRGNSTISLNTAALAAGAYTYSLHVDGSKVDSKQLLIAR